MRILMLSWRSPGHPQCGGAETLTHEILLRAAQRGHVVTWFAAAVPGMAQTELAQDGISYVRLGRQWSVHLRAWRWLRRRRGEFDVVVDQINTLPFMTPCYLPREQRRMFIHQTAREYWWRQTRGLFKVVAPFGFLAEPQYLKTYRTTRTITVSDSTRSELLALGFSDSQITVIPEAINGPRIEAINDKEPGPFRLIVVGRLEPAKFVEEALAAFRQVREAIPDCRMDIVGAGEPQYRGRLEHELARWGLSEAVEFHGRVSEDRKTQLFTRAHVHVFASHREGWGLTVSEAAALGTPTVGYDAPGVRDSVRDPRLLAKLADGPAGLAQRILALHNDSALYREVREDAWRFACSLDYDTTTDTFLEALVG